MLLKKSRDICHTRYEDLIEVTVVKTMCGKCGVGTRTS